MCPQEKLQEQEVSYKNFDELKRDLRMKEAEQKIRFSQMSDEKLIETMESFGCTVVDWKRKFAGGIPEVDKRRLWAKQGFDSILHYASVKAAFSHELTKKILRISRKIYPFGGIRKLFEAGEVGWPKLEEVAGLLTRKNEHIWLERLQTMSTRAIRQVAQYERYLRNPERYESKGETDPNPESKPEPETRPKPPNDTTANTANNPRPEKTSKAENSQGSSSSSEKGAEDGGTQNENETAETAGNAGNAEDNSNANEKVINGASAYRKNQGKSRSNETLSESSAFIESLIANGLAQTHRGRNTVSINLDPLVVQRLLHIQEALSEKYKNTGNKAPNLSETLNFVLTHFDEEAHSMPVYEEVIFRNEQTGELATKTSWGPAIVVEEDLKERKQKYPPIDLDEDRLVAKEVAANYEAKCKAKGKPVGRQIPKAVREFIRRREGGFCCCPGCNKKGKRYHHIKPFSKYRSHDPDGIVLFCVACHKLLHEGVFWLEELKAKTRVALGEEVSSPRLYKMLFRKDTKIRSRSQSVMEKTNRKYQEHKKRACKKEEPRNAEGEAKTKPPKPKPTTPEN